MSSSVLKTLSDGLIVRRAAAADAEALADFNGRIHSEAGPDKPDGYVAAWTRDLASGAHPTFRPDDFTIVEESATGRIVSSLSLISQIWTYAGIPFGVGRPELVGTLPEYRRRGLVRAQMEVVHQWSAERGELLQAITGIPWYYRQFGYEMTVTLGGGRLGFAPNAPKLKEAEAEPFVVRAAAPADLPFMMALYEQAARRSLLACVRPADIWAHELGGKSEKNVNRRELRLITTPGGEPVGFFAHAIMLWDYALAAVSTYEIKSGLSWRSVTPSVIRYLWQTGQAYAARDGKPHHAFAFAGLPPEHPVLEAMPECLPHHWTPYAWYLRVPDVTAFLGRIAPALEQRLAGSVMAGHTGELKIGWYRGGVRLGFDQGCITVNEWQPVRKVDEGQAAFPDLTFLHLLFGHRSLSELRQTYADCWAEDEARVLLNALFPKASSAIWPIE
jgi:hypothetical protein